MEKDLGLSCCYNSNTIIFKLLGKIQIGAISKRHRVIGGKEKNGESCYNDSFKKFCCATRHIR